jgi:adenosylhomocysteine nucleosidase
MPRKSVAVVAAMRRELEPLLAGVRCERVSHLEFFELEGAAVVVGGIGRNAARKATEAAIAKYQPSVIVSAGIAGALTDALNVGDVVHAREVVDAGSGARFAAADGKSVVVSVASVTGPDGKKQLAQRWSAGVVDMEAAVVAAVAQEQGVEFAAVKAISDELGFVMPPVAEFVDLNGKFETLRFAAYVAVRPKWWPAVRQLNANSRVAAIKLSDAVRHLIDQRSMIAIEGKTAGA